MIVLIKAEPFSQQIYEMIIKRSFDIMLSWQL